MAGAIVVLTAAEAARAQSCGHYVKVGGFRGTQDTAAETLHAGHRGFVEMTPDEGMPAEPPPCSGPNCSGMPDSAPAPGAPEAPTSSQLKFLALPSAAGFPAQSGGGWLDLCPLTDERDRPERIFRPPR
jgi:hypothetical protein